MCMHGCQWNKVHQCLLMIWLLISEVSGWTLKWMYTFWVKKVQFEKVIAKVTQELDKPEKWNESGWVSLRISVQMSMLFTCAREKKPRNPLTSSNQKQLHIRAWQSITEKEPHCLVISMSSRQQRILVCKGLHSSTENNPSENNV